jgi:hypothetical protein
MRILKVIAAVPLVLAVAGCGRSQPEAAVSASETKAGGATPTITAVRVSVRDVSASVQATPEGRPNP